MLIRYLYLCILLWLSPSALCAQAVTNYRFVNFSAKDGLVDKFIYAAMQDNLGYMWFGTGSGLYRYDGHLFKRIQSPIDQPGKTINNILQAIGKDEQGNLWLGSVNTLQWYKPATGTFHTPANWNQAAQQSYILNFTTGLKKDMWLATARSFFYRFTSQDSSFQHFNKFPATASRNTLKVAVDHQHVFAIHAEGIYQFSLKADLVRFFPWHNADITNASMHTDGSTVLLTTYTSGLVSFNLKELVYKPLYYSQQALKKSSLLSVAVDAKKRIYTGSYRLDLIDSTAQIHRSFSKTDAGPYALGAEKIGNLFFDREGNLWICSHFGLSMLPWQNQQIQSIKLFDAITKNTVEPVDIISSPDGKEYLITNTSTAGLIVVNATNGEVRTVPNLLGKTIDEKRIYGIVITPDKNILLSDDKHVFEYATGSNKLVLYALNDEHGKPIENIGKSITSKQGDVFIESYNDGFYHWDYHRQKVTHYHKKDLWPAQNDAEDEVLIPSLIDSKQRLWLVSNNGVYMWQYNASTSLHIIATGHPQIPTLGKTHSIAEDAAGHIWIASKTTGLHEWYEKDGKQIINHYNSKTGNGIPADYCWNIRFNKYDSTLWISNISGLMQFDPVTKNVRTLLSRQNGLMEDDGGYTFELMPDGKLAQLYYGELNLLDLQRYRRNTFSSKIQFNSISILNENLPPSLLHKDSLSLSHQQNYLQFELAALLMNNANRTRYLYKMEGIDSNWQQAGNNNTIAYSALAPGKYLFRAKAVNNDGLEGPERILHIQIHPPFYVTWWFITICVLFFLLLLYWWNWQQRKRIRKEEQLKSSFKQLLTETEMKALRAQMNPHFIFNALNSIQKYILKNEQEEAAQYLTKFSKLIRLILDQSNQTIIALSNELALLQLYLEIESMRFDEKFDYEIWVDPKLQTDTIAISSMLIQPFVENAIWHGLLHKPIKGRLSIGFYAEDSNMIRVVIEDNGIGRHQAALLKSKQAIRKKSYGIQITETRLAMLNQLQSHQASVQIEDLVNEQLLPTGTRVTMYIPFSPITNI